MDELEQILNAKMRIYDSLYQIAYQTNNKESLKYYLKCRNTIGEMLKILLV